MSSPLDTGNWYPSFNDEFDSLNLNDGHNGGIWDTSFYFGGHTLSGNAEQEFYTNPSVPNANPFNDPHGTLSIEAKPTDALAAGSADNMPYTSGLITTEHSFSQTYGYFEMRAQLPAGQGMWPAFWLLPADKSWPPEIDVMEAFGAPNDHGEGNSNSIHINAISSNGSEGWGAWVNMPNGGASTQDGFHTYGVDWEPDQITWYIDGQSVGHVPTPSDMNKPMYMLANLAVGGNWVGAPNGETADMNIDYIKAWSHDPHAPLVQNDLHSSIA